MYTGRHGGGASGWSGQRGGIGSREGTLVGVEDGCKGIVDGCNEGYNVDSDEGREKGLPGRDSTWSDGGGPDCRWLWLQWRM